MPLTETAIKFLKETDKPQKIFDERACSSSFHPPAENSGGSSIASKGKKNSFRSCPFSKSALIQGHNPVTCFH